MNRRTHVTTLAILTLAASQTLAQQVSGESEPPIQDQIKIFSLKNTPAEDAEQVLQQILRTPDVRRAPAGVSPAVQKPLPMIQIAVHQSTNSLIVRGPADTLAIAEAIVQRLEEQANQNLVPDTPAALRERMDRMKGIVSARASQRSSGNAGVKNVANKPAEGTRIVAPAPSPDGKPTRVTRMATPGTRVTKGDVLVELDDTQLQEQLVVQRMSLEESKARLRRIEAEIQQVNSDGKLAVAELALRFDTADSALSTYRKANVVLEVAKLESELAGLAQAVATLEHLQNTPEGTQEQLDNARRKLELAKLRHQILVDIQIPAEIARMEGERKLASLALELVREKVAIELDKFAAEKPALATTVKLNEDKVAQLREALGRCVLTAPHDGIVEPMGDPSPVQVGALVRENQPLLILRTEQEAKE